MQSDRSQIERPEIDLISVHVETKYVFQLEFRNYELRFSESPAKELRWDDNSFVLQTFRKLREILV